MTAKVKTGFSQPNPNILGAAKGNFQDSLAMFTSIHARLLALETKTSSGTVTTQGAPISAPPPPASIAVASPAAGQVTVAVTNPQYIPGSKPGTPRGNAVGTAIIHQISYSPTSNFSRNVQTLPPSTQTHYSLPVSGQVFVKIQSSYDGQNFNAQQISKGVTA